jgi:hypothetical protein
MALKQIGCQGGDVINCSDRGPRVHCVKMVMNLEVHKNGSFLHCSTDFLKKNNSFPWSQYLFDTVITNTANVLALSHSSCDPNSATRTLLSSLICTPHFLQKHFNPKPHRHSPKTPPQPPQPSSCKNLRLIIFSYIYFILLFITSSLLSYTHFIRLSFVSSLFPRRQLCFYFLPRLANHNRKRHTYANPSCSFVHFLNSKVPLNLQSLVFRAPPPPLLPPEAAQNACTCSNVTCGVGMEKHCVLYPSFDTRP